MAAVAEATTTTIWQKHTHTRPERDRQTHLVHTHRVGEAARKLESKEHTAQKGAEHWPRKLLKAIYTDAVYFETLVQDTQTGKRWQNDARTMADACERRRHSANIFLYPVLNMASILCRKCASFAHTHWQSHSFNVLELMRVSCKERLKAQVCFNCFFFAAFSS